MFYYAGESRKELRMLRRGVVMDIDPDTGEETFIQLDLHGAGDGAHLPYTRMLNTGGGVNKIQSNTRFTC